MTTLILNCCAQLSEVGIPKPLFPAQILDMIMHISVCGVAIFFQTISTVELLRNPFILCLLNPYEAITVNLTCDHLQM